jgi:hypothetical protein
VIRKLLYHVLPFLLPFIVYAFYVMMTRRARSRGELFDDTPWFWLTAAGLILSIVSVFVFWYFTAEPAGGTYVPPRLEDGQVVPGRIER